MYLTVKQQVKHLSKEQYLCLRELCHIAKNLYNQGIQDVNGTLNIMRKSNVVSLDTLYARGEVDTPVRIRVA